MAKKKTEILLDHDFDGIRELDNDLPPWWLYMFYISIAFALVYLVHYHVLGTGPSSYEEYMTEMNPNWQPEVEARSSLFYKTPFYTSHEDLTPYMKKILQEKEAEMLAKMEETETGHGAAADQLSFNELLMAAMRKAGPADLEKLKGAFPEIYAALQAAPEAGAAAEAEQPAAPAEVIEALTDEASLAKGKEIFTTNCASCHGKLGQGGIGPNMTDDYWLHGGGMTNIVHTIHVGVPAKGMISWRGILQEDQILQVASYLLSLHGTNPPNAKKPQGELWQTAAQD